MSRPAIAATPCDDETIGEHPIDSASLLAIDRDQHFLSLNLLDGRLSTVELTDERCVDVCGWRLRHCGPSLGTITQNP